MHMYFGFWFMIWSEWKGEKKSAVTVRSSDWKPQWEGVLRRALCAAPAVSLCVDQGVWLNTMIGFPNKYIQDVVNHTYVDNTAGRNLSITSEQLRNLSHYWV